MHLRAGLTGSHLHLQPSSPLRLLRLHLQTAPPCLVPLNMRWGTYMLLMLLVAQVIFLLKLYMYILCIIDVWRAGPWHEAGCLMMMEVQGCTMHEASGLIPIYIYIYICKF